MLAFAIKGLIGLALVSFGWLAGSAYPAPQQWTAFVNDRAGALLLDASPDGLARLRASLSPEEFSRLAQDAALLAATTGDVIRIERTPDAVLEEHADAALGQSPAQAASVETALYLCPGMNVTNAPPADEHNMVHDYAGVISVNGVPVAVNPTRSACLASGVGPRNGRRHKGLDYFARNGGPVYAAAGGTVLEKVYRDDYGNMLLIDHGAGVYTRYAHLSTFASDVAIGARVAAGQQIGLMGNTAAYPIPVHLHYELLVGDYDNERRSFGLTPRSPFEFSAAVAPAQVSAAASAPVVPLQLTRVDVGRQICPGGPISSAAVITIRRGDTLSAIARACYGDEEAWRQIAGCNAYLDQRNRGGVSPLNGGHLLYIGDRLALPAPGGACPV